MTQNDNGNKAINEYLRQTVDNESPDIETLVKDYNALKRQNEKLKAENQMYKQIVSDIDSVFKKIANGEKKKRM